MRTLNSLKNIQCNDEGKELPILKFYKKKFRKHILSSPITACRSKIFVNIINTITATILEVCITSSKN